MGGAKAGGSGEGQSNNKSGEKSDGGGQADTKKAVPTDANAKDNQDKAKVDSKKADGLDVTTFFKQAVGGASKSSANTKPGPKPSGNQKVRNCGSKSSVKPNFGFASKGSAIKNSSGVASSSTSSSSMGPSNPNSIL